MSDLDSSLLLSTSGCSSREAVLLQHQAPLDQVALIMTIAMVDISKMIMIFFVRIILMIVIMFHRHHILGPSLGQPPNNTCQPALTGAVCI